MVEAESSAAGDDADVAIVGAGAAGLATAIFAAEEGARSRRPTRIVLLESAPRIGAKILISGGGRCNVTHERVGSEDFNGARNPVRNVLAAFDAAAATRWFESLGVALKREETGKLFPTSDRARSVVDALVGRCRELGVEIRTGAKVVAVAPLEGEHGPAFRIAHGRGELRARRVALATGGRSLPRTGSDGTGYALARALGHEVTATWPALVPLVLRRDFFHATLMGVSHPAELTTLAGGRRVDRRSGSLLWTHFGVSGPVVLDASRHWLRARDAGEDASLVLGVLPGETEESAQRWLAERAAARPRLSLGRLLAERLPERLAAALLAAAAVEPAIALGQLRRDARRRTARVLTAVALPVVASRGWDHAEVTAGGVPLAEVDYRTLESRRARGLYLVGEILDCDGRIGGFNFQWAWATGFLAGSAAVRSLAPPPYT